jgi:hypothetical protein
VASITTPVPAAAPPQTAAVTNVPLAAADCVIANREPAATFPIVDWIPAATDPAATPAVPNPSIIGMEAPTATTIPPISKLFPNMSIISKLIDCLNKSSYNFFRSSEINYFNDDDQNLSYIQIYIKLIIG